MGGLAFSTGPDPLHTPRMSMAVYETARGHVHAVLGELFAAVATPVEGPGKTDFGDVDVEVVLAQPEAQDVDIRALLQTAAQKLGAVRTIFSEMHVQLAMPWPEGEQEAAEPGPTPFVQVDIDIAPSLAAFHWSLFKHGHGDIWNILGTVLRPLGLTVSDSAMWLRVAEVEQSNRKLSRVFLTSTPAEVVDFLGLDMLADPVRDEVPPPPSIWQHPFPDAWTLFEYVARSPYFVLPPADADEDEDAVGRSKANDRRRMRYRPLFRQWATEFVPAWRQRQQQQKQHQKTATTTARPVTRDTVRADAFARFPAAQAVYERTRTTWLVEQQAFVVWAAAKAAVPTDLPGRYRKTACSAVKQRLLQGPQAVEPITDDKDKQAAVLAAWTVQDAAALAKTQWESLTAAAAPDIHAQYTQ